MVIIFSVFCFPSLILPDEEADEQGDGAENCEWAIDCCEKNC